jgi:Spy/CpxP family protein refolding chaperone
MRTRMTALAIAIAAVLTLGIGAAVAMPHASGWGPDQMHGSTQMRSMHAQMPADLQGECDAMHAQMSAQMSAQMGPMHDQSDMGSMHGWMGGGRR